MLVVLRASAHNADLGMWFSKSSRDISPDLSWGAAIRTIYPAGKPATHLLQRFYLNSWHQVELQPVRRLIWMPPESNVTASTESRPRARLRWARAHTCNPCRPSSWGHCLEIACGQTTIQVGTSCWGSTCKVVCGVGPLVHNVQKLGRVETRDDSRA